MPIILYWGELPEQYCLGFVAERCPLCRKVQAFRLVDHVLVQHLNYIPTGPGRHLQTTRQCLGCRSETFSRPEEFDEIISPEEAPRLPFPEVLQRTNRRLAAAIQEQHRLEELLRTSPGDLEARRALLDSRLGCYRDPSKELLAFEDALGQWDDLPPADRPKLLDTLDAYLNRYELAEALPLFIHVMARQAPNPTRYVPLLTVLVLAGFVAIVLSPAWSNLELELRQASLCFLPLLLGSAAVLAWFFFRRLTYRRFMLKKLIPAARQRNLPLQAVHDELAALVATPGLPAKVRGLLNHRSIIAQVLQERQAAAVSAGQGA
jgi:hypothetical protein